MTEPRSQQSFSVKGQRVNISRPRSFCVKYSTLWSQQKCSQDKTETDRCGFAGKTLLTETGGKPEVVPKPRLANP